jgi:hypothetical protein
VRCQGGGGGGVTRAVEQCNGWAELPDGTSSLSAEKHATAAEDGIVGINRHKVYTHFGRLGASAQVIVGSVGAGDDAQTASVSRGVEVRDQALHAHAPCATAATTRVLNECLTFKNAHAR